VRKYAVTLLSGLITVGLLVAAALWTRTGVPDPATAHPTSSPLSAAGRESCPTKAREGMPGQRVKSPQADEVYMIDPEGFKRYIPDPETYFAFFLGWKGLITTAETPCYRTGEALERGRDFLARSPAGTYYFVDATKTGHVARLIPSATVSEKYYFNSALAVPTEQPWLDRHRGPDWS
jgi:hypothetical protein